MMTRCEDAPCCGCCGTNLYGTNESVEPEYYSDDYDEVEPDECQPHNSYCANDDEDCTVCRGYWLDFHADGMEDQWLDGSYEE